MINKRDLMANIVTNVVFAAMAICAVCCVVNIAGAYADSGISDSVKQEGKYLNRNDRVILDENSKVISESFCVEDSHVEGCISSLCKRVLNCTEGSGYSSMTHYYENGTNSGLRLCTCMPALRVNSSEIEV